MEKKGNLFETSCAHSTNPLTLFRSMKQSRGTHTIRYKINGIYIQGENLLSSLGADWPTDARAKHKTNNLIMMRE